MHLPTFSLLNKTNSDSMSLNSCSFSEHFTKPQRSHPLGKDGMYFICQVLVTMEVFTSATELNRATASDSLIPSIKIF